MKKWTKKEKKILEASLKDRIKITDDGNACVTYSNGLEVHIRKDMHIRKFSTYHTRLKQGKIEKDDLSYHTFSALLQDLVEEVFDITGSNLI